MDPQTQPRKETAQKDLGNVWYVLSLAFLGLYTNAAAYGFQFSAGSDYSLFLPMANWFRDPSLYPGDPIRDAFPHIQTFYWPLVAILSRHYGMEPVLLGLFLATKFIFFAAVALLVGPRVRHGVLGTCIVMALAVSPILNNQTPIGGTIILDQISEHAALGLAIVLLAGVLLLDGRWRTAALVAGLSVYVDALPFVHTLPVFAVFALVDWRTYKRQIAEAAVIGAGVFLPWFVHFHRSFLTDYPSDYVSVLLLHYPLHITLRWTPVSQIIEGAVLLLATVCMWFLIARGRTRETHRLGLLAETYFFVMLFGILAGWFWLTPGVARLMLQRADSLWIPYSFLLIQLSGVRVVELPAADRPVSTCLLATLAISSPLSSYGTALLFPAMLFWLDPKRRLDRFLAGKHVRRLSKRLPAISVPPIVAALCALGIVVSFASLFSSTDQLWNFHIPDSPDETACYDAQIWARTHTPKTANFLVPPEGCGFRSLSERPSWGEWSDGNAMYFYPPFADTFLKRVAVLDHAPRAQGAAISDSLTDVYRSQSWDRIRTVANENGLAYILQFGSVKYSVEPVYANAGFAIYSAK